MLHRPLAISSRFNSLSLNRFILKEKIDIVLNGSYYMFNIPEKRGYKYVFDLADIPTDNPESRFGRFISRQAKEEIAKADAVTAVSDGLAEYTLREYGRRPHVVHNGAYIEKMRSVRPEATAQVRKRYGLADKWVIGYIGLLGPWVEIDTLVEAFVKVRKNIPNAALMLIGASPNIAELRKKYASDNIIVTGTLKGEAAVYVNSFDVGVLPHKKTLFQDLAFHIKLIEYTAARKIAVATPIEEVKRLDFPNIIQADLNADIWKEAFLKAKETLWRTEWDSLVKPYDWNAICNGLVRVLERQ
jgi:glycosyltransferase involved in cell wall biosynthesis